MKTSDRKKLMKRAWALKNKKPYIPFSKCLKWSWCYTGLVFGKEQEPEPEVIINSVSEVGSDFISGMFA